jgi:hypothetical protein
MFDDNCSGNRLPTVVDRRPRTDAATRQAQELLTRWQQRREEIREIKRVAETFGCSESAARRLIAKAKLSGAVQPDGTIIDP